MLSSLEAIYLQLSGSSSTKPTDFATREGIGIGKAVSMRGYAATLMGSLRCEEHRRLMENFAAVAKELLGLHHQQIEAAVHGDPDCIRFDLLIHMANERKQKAKYSYLRHVEEHGCNRFDLIISRDQSEKPSTVQLRSQKSKALAYTGTLSRTLLVTCSADRQISQNLQERLIVAA